MGILVGSWGFLHSPLSVPFSSSHPSSSSSTTSLFISSFHGKDIKKKKKKKRKNLGIVAMASPTSDDKPLGSIGASGRRAVLVVGISVLPFLNLRAMAAKDLTIDMQNAVRPGKAGSKNPLLEVLSADQAELQSAPVTSFISILNGLGIVGSGILGALYAISQKEKMDTESNFESMKVELAEQEKAVSSLKKNFEARFLREQEEREKQAEKLKEDEASLLNQLASANEMVATLHQELEHEKKLFEKVKEQISQYQSSATQFAADKKELEDKLEDKVNTVDALQDRVSLLGLEMANKDKNIDNVKSSLCEKESENKKLNSTIHQLRGDLAVATSTIEQFKEEINRAREELNSKFSSMDYLKERLHSLQAEKDESVKKIQDLMEEFNDLKASSEKRAALDIELLSEKDDQFHQLEEKLELASSEASNKDAVINELSKERDEIKALLQQEEYVVKSVKYELQATQDSLRATKNDVTSLSKELDEAKRLYESVVSEASKIQNDFLEINSLLTIDLEESRSTCKLLSDELVLVKELLRRTREDLDITSRELKDMVVERDDLKQELLQTYKKLETAVHDVQQERKVISTLNKELEILGKQVQRDSEARRALASDLDEATKSLDEMNKSALLLSRELENSNTIIANLEAEKAMLFKALTEQKKFSKEAQENFDDAQNLITRLGSERATLEKTSRELAEELASAKGEILRLRRQMSMKKASVNGNQPKTSEISPGTTDTVRKTPSRKRKGGST